MWADPAVTRYIGGNPSTEQQTWSRMLAYAGLWAYLGFGYWAIEEKASGTFAGDLGFADFHRDISPAMKGVPELGWALATRMHGRGYATEAVRAALAWGDASLEASRTVCLIDPENAASIAVARKCGYGEFERAPFAGRQAIFFERAAQRR
jgi:RimJ/RimL family protein N-acetyltransferase